MVTVVVWLAEVYLEHPFSFVIDKEEIDLQLQR